MLEGSIRHIVAGRVVAAGDLRNLKQPETNEGYTVRFLRQNTIENHELPTDLAVIYGAHGQEVRLLQRVAGLLGEEVRAGRAVVDFDYRMSYASVEELAFRAGLAIREFARGLNGAPSAAPTSTSSSARAAVGRATSSDRSAQTATEARTYATRGADPLEPTATYAEARFSHRAHEHLAVANAALAAGLEGRQAIGVVDSGLAPSTLTSRMVTAFDLSRGAPIAVQPGSTDDVVGHGTRVARILDAVLPQQCNVVMSMLGHPENVTASSVTLAMTCCAEGLPNQPLALRPSVVSMSLVPMLEGRAPSAHQSLLVPFMASRYPETAFLMAAGNDGGIVTPAMEVSNLFYGVALDERMQRAEYSAAPRSADSAVCAFGGSDAQPFFEGSGSCGTSWATPLVGAACLLVTQKIRTMVRQKSLPNANVSNQNLGTAFTRAGLGFVPDCFVRDYPRALWLLEHLLR